MMALQVKKATPLQAAPIMPPPLSRQARSSVVLLLALSFFLPCCHGARTTPLSSSQLASSAPHRRCRMRPYRLFRPRHQCNRSAKPAAEESRARRSSQSMAAPPQQRAAAWGREQAPHRRVDEVAHAGHQHPRYERLGKQQEYTGVNGNILSHIANPVISERKKTIGIFAIQNSTKII